MKFTLAFLLMASVGLDAIALPPLPPAVRSAKSLHAGTPVVKQASTMAVKTAVVNPPNTNITIVATEDGYYEVDTAPTPTGPWVFLCNEPSLSGSTNVPMTSTNAFFRGVWRSYVGVTVTNKP